MTLEIIAQPDYKSIGKKLLSGEVLNNAETSVIFSIGLKFADNLVQEKIGSIIGFEGKDDAVKDYVKYAVLGRALRLHDEVLKSSVLQSDAEDKFGEMKGKICKSLSIDSSLVSDNALVTMLNESLDTYLDKHFIPKIEDEMGFIRRVASQVIAENSAVKSDIKGIAHPLD